MRNHWQTEKQRVFPGFLRRDVRLFRSILPGFSTAIRTLLLGAIITWNAPVSGQSLIICSSSDNDLYRALQDSGIKCGRFDLPDEAVQSAPTGSGVLLLAEGYPKQPTQLTESLLAEAKAKHLRLYVEFPASLPGLDVGKPREVKWERAIVTSDDFGPDLKRLRLADLHKCQFMSVFGVSASATKLVLGRVAGFDTAVFGLPKQIYPLLFEAPQGNLLVAATKLSQFVTARYAPPGAWTPIWKYILHWLNPKLDTQKFHWSPTVAPGYGRDAVLPADYERKALERGVAWYNKSHILLTPARESEYLQHTPGTDLPPAIDSPIGDGSQGIFEGFKSTILPDGRQLQSIARRSDCIAESAMSFAFGAKVLDQMPDAGIASNLLNFLYFNSDARKREYADPTNGAYGLIAWGMDNDWFKATYGDDEARVLLATVSVSTLLNQHQWDKAMLRCLLADLRTSGRLGFRQEMIDLKQLRTFGWRHYFDQDNTLFAPHFESYLWACYLWAYQRTGFELFRERAETAIRLTMKAYPNRWRWTNGIQQERARMLLPLAWLVRVDDTPEHREWLKRMATDLLALQDKSGAIREEIGALENGYDPPPQSNAAYGNGEASVLQQNGDPVCDLLYTCNFAFLGLHEATAATGDPFYAHAEGQLAQFLCRIQIKSTAHPELDGGWYRAFDFARWDYWASSGDSGWGAWCIESGWPQSWICSVLAMRQSHISLWGLATESPLKKYLAQLRPEMIPDDALAALMKSKNTSEK